MEYALYYNGLRVRYPDAGDALFGGAAGDDAVILLADAKPAPASTPGDRGHGSSYVDEKSGTFPLGWTRTYGDGKVFVTLLGHNGLSFETPEFQKMVLNGVDWAMS